MYIPVEVVIVPAVFGIPAIVLVVMMSFRHKEKMARVTGAPVPLASIESRLERMEQAIESIAIEMERMGEGQRFVTKLLSERTESRAELPSPDKR